MRIIMYLTILLRVISILIKIFFTVNFLSHLWPHSSLVGHAISEHSIFLHNTSRNVPWLCWNIAPKLTSSEIEERGGPPAWGLGVGLTTPHRKK
jgi:hypothetical protein